MSKKDFIALADAIRAANQEFQTKTYSVHKPFGERAINKLADFCQSRNPRFLRERWLGYIAGECGPNGGAVKKAA
jgi:hypothetical protein